MLWGRITGLAVVLLVGLFPTQAGAVEPPPDSLIANSSFEVNTTGWGGLNSTRTSANASGAPHGTKAVTVTAQTKDQAFTLNSAVSVAGVNGAPYTGTIWLKGGANSTGRTARVVVREFLPGGGVDYSYEDVVLSSVFKQVVVTYTAQSSASTIDFYVARDTQVTNHPRETFYADLATLQRGPVPSGPAASTVSSMSIVGSSDDELTNPADDSARYVILRDDVSTGIPNISAIRAANPGAELLVYKNVPFTVFDGGTEQSPTCPSAPAQGAGVDFCTANPNESWFLHDANGDRLNSADFSSFYAMDPGNADYQEEWASSVLARLNDVDRDGNSAEGINDHYDGVFMDDVNVLPGHGLNAQGIAGMPSQGLSNSAYRAAMVEFIDEVAPQIGAQGFTTMANVSQQIFEPAERAAALDIAADIDVYNQEQFFRWYFVDVAGNVTGDELFGEPGYFPLNIPDWSDWQAFMDDVQALGTSYHGMTYGHDAGANNVEGQRFARASFLLGWDGTDGSALAYRSYDDTAGGPLGLSDWTTDIGSPLGDFYAVEPNTFRRQYSGGTVVLNADIGTSPNYNDTSTVTLDASYRLPSGACVNSVTLQDRQALVLPYC